MSVFLGMLQARGIVYEISQGSHHLFPSQAIFQCPCFFSYISLVDIKILSKKRKEQERCNLLKKANESCKALDELFQNSAPEEKDHPISELKDSEPGILCSNKSVNFDDIISNTSEGDKATLKKDIEIGFSAKKKPAYKISVSKNNIWE